MEMTRKLSRIQATFDKAQKLLEERYQRDCEKFGPEKQEVLYKEFQERSDIIASICFQEIMKCLTSSNT